MSASAVKPDLIKQLFVTKETNAAGIYNVKLYIRGKPWVVTIDDSNMFENDTIFHKWFSDVEPNLLFGRLSEDYPSIWAPLLEKAYAKYIGNMVNLHAGQVSTALRTLLGCPTTNLYIFNYYSYYINSLHDWLK